MISYISKESVV